MKPSLLIYRARYASAALLLLITPLAAIAQTTSTWNGTTGNWSDFTKWNTDPLFPNNGNGGNDYNAIINGGTVTLDQDIEIEGLTLAGGILTGNTGASLSINDTFEWTNGMIKNGTLTGPSDWTVSGNATWSGGTLSGAGLITVSPSAALTIDNNGNHPKNLNRSVINDGAVNWNGGVVSMNGVTFTNNGSFTANPGNFEYFDGVSGTNVFNNAGTFTKLGNTTVHFPRFASPTAVVFNNSGTVDVQAGKLDLLSGGTHTGDFTGQSGAALQFGGNHNFAAGSEIFGNMSVSFFGGTSTYAGSLDTTGTIEFIDSTASVAGSLNAGTLNVMFKTVNVNGPITMGGGTIANNATLTGPSNWTITGNTTWSGGRLSGAGLMTINSGAALTIDNPIIKYLNRSVVNNGIVTWNEGDIELNGVTFTNNGNFTSSVSQAGAFGYFSGPFGANTFNNSGTFTKLGQGTTQFREQVIGGAGMTFNNSGAVDIQGGTLDLAAGGTHSGDFTGLPGGSIRFGGNHTFAPGSEINGPSVVFYGGTSTYAESINTAGTVEFQGPTASVAGSINAGTLKVTNGTVTIGGPITMDDGIITNGTLTGPADWTINGNATWSGGTLSGAGLITVSPSAALTIDNNGNHPKNLNRSVINDGAVNWNGGVVSMNGVTFTNNGSFTANPGNFEYFDGVSGTNVFNNAGTFTKLGNTTVHFPRFASPTAVVFNNSGTVDVQAGKLDLLSGGTHTGDFTGQSGAALQFGGNHNFAAGSEIFGNMSVSFFGGTSTYAGSLDTTGTIEFIDSTASVAGSLNAGTLNVMFKTVNVNGPITVGTTTIGSGAGLRGAGSFGSFSNFGTLAPGNSPGIITIDGDFTQGSTGVLEIEVGGLTPGTEHDQLIVTGAATLGGTIEFPIINGFAPQLNDEITFLTAASVTGSPNALLAPNLAQANPDVAFQVIKNPTDLRLRFVDKGVVQFVDNTGGVVDPMDWNEAANWEDNNINRVPEISDVVSLTRTETGDVIRVEVKNEDAFTYELTVQDISSPIEIAVTNGYTLSAAVGDVTIGDNATIALGSTMTTGTLAAAQTVEVLDGGTLRGNGTVVGEAVVDGTISPGFSVGHLDIDGNLQLSGNAQIILEIEGISDFDTLDITGDAALGGSLSVLIPNDGSVQAGDTFTVITAGDTMDTKFDDIFTIGNDDLFAKPVYNENEIALFMASEGDMDQLGDGVTEDDVIKFAMALTDPDRYDNEHDADAREAGDIDDDGDCDVDDIDNFAELLGMSVAALTHRIQAYSTQVPEPSTLMLVMLVLGPGLLRRNFARGIA